MSIHNICFCGDIKNKYQYFLVEKKKKNNALSGARIIWHSCVCVSVCAGAHRM